MRGGGETLTLTIECDVLGIFCRISKTEMVKPASHMQSFFSIDHAFDRSLAFYRLEELVARPASLLLLLPG